MEWKVSLWVELCWSRWFYWYLNVTGFPFSDLIGIICWGGGGLNGAERRMLSDNTSFELFHTVWRVVRFREFIEAKKIQKNQILEFQHVCSLTSGWELSSPIFFFWKVQKKKENQFQAKIETQQQKGKENWLIWWRKWYKLPPFLQSHNETF